MFGLDEAIVHLSGGTSVLIFVLVAALLGLRHAADPDHLAAVSTLVASGEERAGRAAARLGAFWGLGHALALLAFGLPILVFQQYLPDRVQQGSTCTRTRTRTRTTATPCARLSVRSVSASHTASEAAQAWEC